MPHIILSRNFLSLKLQMARTYKRVPGKKQRNRVDMVQMNKAIEAVKNGMTQSEACIKFKVARSALYRRLSRPNVNSHSGPRTVRFSVSSIKIVLYNFFPLNRSFLPKKKTFYALSIHKINQISPSSEFSCMNSFRRLTVHIHNLGSTMKRHQQIGITTFWSATRTWKQIPARKLTSDAKWLNRSCRIFHDLKERNNVYLSNKK